MTSMRSAGLLGFRTASQLLQSEEGDVGSLPNVVVSAEADGCASPAPSLTPSEVVEAELARSPDIIKSPNGESSEEDPP